MMNNPQPWFSHAANSWLEENISFYWNVFEFGSGSSSIWMQSRVRSLITVEHDDVWYSFVDRCKAPNVTILFKEKPYHQAIEPYENNSFDLIIVDGRHRVKCVLASLNKLKSGGYLILDDAQRSYYRPAIDAIEDQEWEEIGPFKAGGDNDPWRLTRVWRKS